MCTSDLFPDPPKAPKPRPTPPNPELTARLAKASQEATTRRQEGARRGTSAFRLRLSSPVNLPR